MAAFVQGRHRPARSMLAAVSRLWPDSDLPVDQPYVGCLRASGLVMLAARFSESDPGRVKTQNPEARRE